MTPTDKQFAGRIPEIYDRYLAPLIFQPYADDLAARIAPSPPASLLEIAAGTGAVTRALAARLPPTSKIMATDLNQPMLDRAAAALNDDRVTWREADALSLPFADRSFDVAVCQFGVMFFPDKPKAHSEARRVLRSGGRYVFSVWDALSANEFTAVVTEALDDVFASNPIRFMERVPHGYCDPGRIRTDLEAGGFGGATIETVSHVARAAGARDVAIAFCQGTPIFNEIASRDPAKIEEATDRAAALLERRFGAGPIEGAIRALVVEARA